FLVLCLFFFFQAEDGIRDFHVTGVQTCALPIWSTDREPEIRIKSEEVDGHIHISVEDNGLGISKDKIDLLFVPYSRLEKKVEGTGIGLYLVKKLIENEGGKIEVESELGIGSIFKVKLAKAT